MDYFLIKQSGTVTIPKDTMAKDTSSEDPSVRIMQNVSSLDQFDYISQEHLISDPLKQLLEQYLPEQFWRPCVFVDTQKQEMKTFWFLPDLPYVPKKVVTASNGIPAYVYVDAQDFAKKAPAILLIHVSKGMSFLVVHLSVAESILRRGICGLEIIRLNRYDND